MSLFQNSSNFEEFLAIFKNRILPKVSYTYMQRQICKITIKA